MHTVLVTDKGPLTTKHSGSCVFVCVGGWGGGEGSRGRREGKKYCLVVQQLDALKKYCCVVQKLDASKRYCFAVQK